MNIFYKVSKATLWQLLGKLTTTLSTFIVLGIVSRQYGQSGLGIYTLALTFLTFFYTVVDFGFNAHLLPQLVEDDYRAVWRKLFSIRMLLALLLLPIMLLIGLTLPLGDNQFKMSVVLGAPVVFGYAIFLSSQAYFQARIKFNLATLSLLSNAMIALVITVSLVFLKVSVAWLILGHLFGWILSALLSIWLIRKEVPIKVDLVLEPLVNLAKKVWPISVTLVLNIIYFRIDSFILASVKGFADAGIYNLAYQVFQNALVMPTFIMNSFYPLMILALSKNKKTFISTWQRSLAIMLVLSIAATLLTILASPLIINLLSGEAFGDSGTVLQILSLGFPAYFLSAVTMWTLVLFKKYKQLLFIYLSSLTLNTILNLLFVPHYSYLASSWITVGVEYLILSLQIIILIPSLRKLK